MKNIQKVVVGSNVTALEVGLFKDLTYLKEVDFSKCKVDIQIPKECFSGCSHLEKCDCPSGSTKIEDKTFYNCTSLATVKLPTSVTNIGVSAFDNCQNLKTVSNTAAVTNVSDDAFQNCNQLHSISLKNVKTIGDNAFRDCTQLESVDRFNDGDGSTLATAFETVGEYAFAHTNLKKASLTLRASADRTWWGEYCFASCDSLESVEFPASYYLGSHMFDHCTKLSSINFSNKTPNVSYVGKYVFKDCTSLTSVTFSNQQFSFLQGFFEGCTKLKEVKFDKYDSGSFCYVQKYAFNGCNQLTSIEFPASLNDVSKLEDAALSGCSSLKTIIFHGIAKESISDDGKTITDTRLINTGFLRAGHDLTVKTSNGSSLTYTYKSEIPYDPPYEYPANKDAVSEFKTPAQLCKGYRTMRAAVSAPNNVANPWYYNIKEVVAEAQNRNIPALCFYSYETCTPCQSFKTNIYESPDFQDWIKDQEFLVCRIEADKPKAYDKELAYCEDVLSRDALNYCKNGVTTPTDYNGFGNYPGKGFFKDNGPDNKNLTPPVLVFYYKNSSGKQVAYHDYSLHSLDAYINQYGVEKMTEMIKSLCLYHFDNNDPTDAQYVKGDVMPFDRKDYVLENPYRVDDTTITLSRWDKMKGKAVTVENVKAEMVKIMASFTSPSAKYPEYIGGCLFGDFDWITLTFSNDDYNTLEGAEYDAEAKNDVLKKIRIEIGDKQYYHLSLSKTDFKTGIATPCDPPLTIYKYDFVKI